MEHTGVIPQVAVRSPELAELVRSEGPFVTVYLTTEADIDNAAQRSEQRWKTLRGDLAGAGASKAALDTIEAVCRGDHDAGGRAATGTLTERFGWLAAPRSTVVQPGPVHGGQTDDPAAHLARLLDTLVG